jgi:hypothetical protein
METPSTPGRRGIFLPRVPYWQCEKKRSKQREVASKLVLLTNNGHYSLFTVLLCVWGSREEKTRQGDKIRNCGSISNRK